MHSIADVVFGFSEKLGIGLGHQQPSHLQRFILDLLTDDLGDSFGLGFLFRCQLDLGHDASPDVA
jgi:hypothetical protein